MADTRQPSDSSESSETPEPYDPENPEYEYSKQERIDLVHHLQRKARHRGNTDAWNVLSALLQTTDATTYALFYLAVHCGRRPRTPDEGFRVLETCRRLGSIESKSPGTVVAALRSRVVGVVVPAGTSASTTIYAIAKARVAKQQQ